MNELHAQIAQTLEGLQERHGSTDAPSVWRQLEIAEMTAVAVPDGLGGAGGDWRDACFIAQCASRLGIGPPVADAAVLGAALLTAGGMTRPEGLTSTLAEAPGLVLREVGETWRVDGHLSRVPYGQYAAHVVVLVDSDEGPRVVVLPRDGWVVDDVDDLSGDPRAEISVAQPLPPGTVSAPNVMSSARARSLGALTAVIKSLGGLERILELTVSYVNEREQFGRSLAKFQVVQHLIAELAAELEAARAVAELAMDGDEVTVAFAKVRTGRAVERASAIAHQLHGAIGFTDEHELHRFTRRVWAWRDEYGSEFEWADHVGGAVTRTPDGLWPWIVNRLEHSAAGS
ncbi:acyl-CoA dehydrogenase family protein [Nocardioides pyridinolyticus]